MGGIPPKMTENSKMRQNGWYTTHFPQILFLRKMGGIPPKLGVANHPRLSNHVKKDKG